MSSPKSIRYQYQIIVMPGKQPEKVDSPLTPSELAYMKEWSDTSDKEFEDVPGHQSFDLTLITPLQIGEVIKLREPKYGDDRDFSFYQITFISREILPYDEKPKQYLGFTDNYEVAYNAPPNTWEVDFIATARLLDRKIPSIRFEDTNISTFSDEILDYVRKLIN
ncbi:MAG: hypothetical protein AAF378_05125 [Cyanobacteria bacterium P01_A01_bin.84]